ncbi:protein Flattop homolog [Sycon ciliatum]|uniref:protein Flattop homolog n=1 Tax=Sycon ciliatum TaxID=27933 RepID=UPI0020AC2795|eukprot:scpid100825/ scgid30854/ UPF0740 protein v1g200856
MANNFSANQYENAFRSTRLQQWTVPQVYREHPVARAGTTQVITNDRGHIIDEKKRSDKPAFGDFRGTWSMTKEDMVKTQPTLMRPLPTDVTYRTNKPVFQ